MAGKYDQKMLNVGFGNTVVAGRVIAVIVPGSSPAKRLRDEAKEEKHLIDATHGKKTRSIIVMDSNHVVLSAIHAETISGRLAALKNQPKENENENEI